MPTIHTRIEHKRGCGFRKPGGLYMMADGLGRSCGRMPIILEICPTCGGGIKPSRGWTWIDGDAVLAKAPECRGARGVKDLVHGVKVSTGFRDCSTCPMGGQPPVGRVGLLWIGGSFYKTPEDFAREAERMGVSRRIPAVPNGFKLGETWVWIAHREAIPSIHGGGCQRSPGQKLLDGCSPHCRPAIAAVFQAFKPQRIEYVVKDSDTDEELDRLEKRGITLVRIERAQAELPLETSREIH